MIHIHPVFGQAVLGRVNRENNSNRVNPHALQFMAAVLALGWAAPAWSEAALPQGFRPVSGSAQLMPAEKQLTIVQSSDKLVLDWKSFNIGAAHEVIFKQLNASSQALNRVIGTERSVISGKLQSNGQVFLLNPHGVLFGKTAQVDVGGLVASTLNISDKDFLQGRLEFSGQGSGARGGDVINQGSISVGKDVNHGFVALLGGRVSNQGEIAARLGSVALVAGNQLSLDFAGDGLLKVKVIESAADTLAENSGLIQADGGSVLLTAQATNALLQTVVNNTGLIRAQTVENSQGKIELRGGLGRVEVSGQLDASAQGIGSGGWIDTSGTQVKVYQGAEISTRAVQGETGTWQITSAEQSVMGGDGLKTASGIAADTLTRSLEKNNVVLQTAGVGIEKGDININALLFWSRNTLTLNSHRSINVNAMLTASSTAGLEMNYGGYSAASPRAVSGSSVNMARKSGLFAARVDFTGKDDSGRSSNHLSINGEHYTIVAELGSADSMTGLDLQGINANLNGNYALAADIDASMTAQWNAGQGFKPIDSSDQPFTGKFQGLGHQISGLYIHRPAEDYQGLFGRSEGAVSNLGVAGSVTGRFYSGALLGFLGDVHGSSIRRGMLRNVYATGSVTGAGAAGGLVGASYNSHITSAYAQSQVSVNRLVDSAADTNGAFAGGLVGRAVSATMNNVCAKARVKGDESIGGLIGASRYSQVNKAFAISKAEGSNHIGGLIGSMQGGSVSRAKVKSTVHGKISTGGIIGFVQQGKISGVEALADVHGQVFAGGIIGQMVDGSMHNAALQGSVSGAIAGGVLGYMEDGTVEGFSVKGNIYGSRLAGGIVGAMAGASISKGRLWGDVTGLAASGLAGDQSAGSMTDVKLRGSVSGNQANGLVGNQSGGSIANSSVIGDVTGYQANGLVGEQNGGSMTDVKLTGNVTGYSANGLGCRQSGGSISNASVAGNVAGEKVQRWFDSSTGGAMTNTSITGVVVAEFNDVPKQDFYRSE